MISSSPTISKLVVFVSCSVALAATGCRSSSADKAEEDILRGTIAYPFVATPTMGKDRPSENFVLKSVVGSTEYIIEIPGGARDYDVEVPLANLESQTLGGPDRPKGLAKPAVTDREMVASLPKIEQKKPGQTALLDKAFGVGPKGGPSQSPSFTLGLAKVTNLYKAKQFEYALIEINNLLAFYPNSPRLHKMKGTVLIKTGYSKLAAKSWQRALELQPDDVALRKGLSRLSKQLELKYAP